MLDEQTVTYAEAGRALGLTRQAVRQWHQARKTTNKRERKTP